jgi:hypothetical protein
LVSHISAQALVIPFEPRGQFISYDTLAMSQGVIVPPHIEMKCWFYSLKSYFTQISVLSQKTEIVATYLRQKFRKSLPSQNEQKKIFIGHGRSLLWRDLSSFISDRLNLDWDEFNRESAAGISISRANA